MQVIPRESKFSLKYEHRKENELNLQFHFYRKIQCSVGSFKPQYTAAKPKNYQQNTTVGGGFNSIRESFRDRPELTVFLVDTFA